MVYEKQGQIKMKQSMGQDKKARHGYPECGTGTAALGKERINFDGIR